MKIVKENMTVEGDNIVEIEEGVTCGCGNPKLQMTCHTDGTTFYSYSYVCRNCGNGLVATFQRDKSDPMYYDESEEQ